MRRPYKLAPKKSKKIFKKSVNKSHKRNNMQVRRGGGRL